MQLQTRLLSLAIVSAIAAASAPSFAANHINRAAAARAQGLVASSASRAVNRRMGDGFVARDTIVGARGKEHVRFARTYRGLPVIGGDFVLHTRNGKVKGVSQTLETTARPDTNARINRRQAIIEAGTDFGTDFQGMPKARLVVYALGATPVLAYEVTFSGFKADQTPTDMHYFVDADTGRILNQWDTVQTARRGPGGGGRGRCTGPVAAVGTGKTFSAGTVGIATIKCGASYQLKDSTRGNSYTTNMAMRTRGSGSIFTDADNIWGNNALSNSQTIGAEAHYGVAVTWDYFLNEHGRLGIADDGKGVLARVHFGRNYANAFWSDACFCMTFGDGDGVTINPLTTLDVAGHEMSHGVTSQTANLVYSGEPGGLNEATSDIFGAMVEYSANSAADPGDYLIGEEVFANNTGALALRYMFKPSLDGRSPDCYYDDIGDIDVHYSSGVANHFYYLLAEGAVVPSGFGEGTEADLAASDLVCNGNTAIAGIGREDAGRIWYVALSQYMTSGTDYAQARIATLNAATALFGAGSTEHNAVAAAWSAVGVN